MSNAAAITTWLFIKAEVRKRIPRAEFELWLYPARLLHVSPVKHEIRAMAALIVALPRNGRAIWKARGRRDLVQKIGRDAGYEVFFTIAPDEYDNQRITEIRGYPFSYLDPEPKALPFRRSRATRHRRTTGIWKAVRSNG